MKSIKRLFSLFLGVLTLFTCTQNAFAEIEMWTFNDGTRVSRFKYTDIDDMIAFYENLVRENEKRKFTKGQNTAIKISGIGAGLCSLIGSGALIYSCVTSGNTDNTNELKEKLGAGILGLIGILSIIASFYPEYVNYKVKKSNLSGIQEKELENGGVWLGLKDICNLLKIIKSKLDELKSKGIEDETPYEKMYDSQKLQVLLTGGYKLLSWKDVEEHPYYILVERPKSVYQNDSCHTWNSIYAGYMFHCYDSGKNDTNMESKLKKIMDRLKSLENLKISKIDKLSKCTFDQKAIDNK